MKLFVSMLLLAGATALTTPAHAQKAAARPAAARDDNPSTGPQSGNMPAKTAEITVAAADSKPTWQQRRAIKKKKLTPYAEAMLHNELLREEPAKKAGAGLL